MWISPPRPRRGQQRRGKVVHGLWTEETRAGKLRVTNRWPPKAPAPSRERPLRAAERAFAAKARLQRLDGHRDAGDDVRMQFDGHGVSADGLDVPVELDPLAVQHRAAGVLDGRGDV